MGTNDLTDLIISGGKLSKLVVELKKGVDIGDIDDAVAFATTLPAAIDGIGNVPAEIEDLDTAERQEIDTLLETEFGIFDDEQKQKAFKCFVNAGFYAAQGALVLSN